MGQWVLTVAGITILSVICDIILPDGRTRKYVKTVVGIIVTVVMVQPILSLLDNSLVAGSSPPQNENGVNIQESYLMMVEEKQLQYKISNVKSVLEVRGIDVREIDVNTQEKKATLSIAAEYSADKKNNVENVFNTYFKEYKITIKWKQ